MIIEELKDKLNQYPDDCDIEIIDEDSNEFYLLDIDKSENYDNCITLYIAQ